MAKEDLIVIDPDIRGGKPCIRGTRITVYDILEYMAGGMTETEILADFPSLQSEHLRAVLTFAADREFLMMDGRTMALEFEACLRKEPTGDLSGDDLQLGRLYELVEKDAGHGMIRIIDESGEDYLYPQAWFDSVMLSEAARQQLAKALPH